MNNLILKLQNLGKNKCEVFVDNKRVKLKKNEFGNYSALYSTEKSEVDIKIRSIPNELAGKFWFWKYLLYFVVSVFGIFDSRYSNNDYGFCYQSKLKLSEKTEVDILFNQRKDNEKVFIDKNNLLQDNETNIYKYDKSLKKRRKIAYAIKFGSWILIAFAIILGIIIK